MGYALPRIECVVNRFALSFTKGWNLKLLKTSVKKNAKSYGIKSEDVEIHVCSILFYRGGC